MLKVERYSDLVSRLSYDCENKYKENINNKNVDIFTSIKNEFDTIKVLYGGGIDSPNNIGNDLELVDYHYSNGTLYISVKVNDNNPHTEDSIIIGCTGTNDDLEKFEIGDWSKNFLGIGAQMPSHGNIDYNTSFYEGVRGFIADQRNNGDIIGRTAQDNQEQFINHKQKLIATKEFVEGIAKQIDTAIANSQTLDGDMANQIRN